jgi:hypothetical protein
MCVGAQRLAKLEYSQLLCKQSKIVTLKKQVVKVWTALHSPRTETSGGLYCEHDEGSRTFKTVLFQRNVLNPSSGRRVSQTGRKFIFDKNKN